MFAKSPAYIIDSLYFLDCGILIPILTFLQLNFSPSRQECQNKDCVAFSENWMREAGGGEGRSGARRLSITGFVEHKPFIVNNLIG